MEREGHTHTVSQRKTLAKQGLDGPFWLKPSNPCVLADSAAFERPPSPVLHPSLLLVLKVSFSLAISAEWSGPRTSRAQLQNQMIYLPQRGRSPPAKGEACAR